MASPRWLRREGGIKQTRKEGEMAREGDETGRQRIGLIPSGRGGMRQKKGGNDGNGEGKRRGSEE